MDRAECIKEATPNFFSAGTAAAAVRLSQCAYDYPDPKQATPANVPRSEFMIDSPATEKPGILQELAFDVKKLFNL